MSQGVTAEEVLKETFKLYAEARYTWSGVTQISDAASKVNFSEHAEFFASMQFELADLAIVRVAKLFDKTSKTWSIKNLLSDLDRFKPIDNESSLAFLEAYSCADLALVKSPRERVEKFAARILEKHRSDIEAVLSSRHDRVAHASRASANVSVTFGNIDDVLEVGRKIIQLAGAVFYNRNLRPDGVLAAGFFEFPGLRKTLNRLAGEY
jgi:hypothetical protein